MLENYQKNVKYNSLIIELENISNNLYKGITTYGILKDPDTGEQFFAYEIDGYGNSYFMDEPRYPSLLSLPFFGFCNINDEIYVNTRKRILSKKNPYYIILPMQREMRIGAPTFSFFYRAKPNMFDSEKEMNERDRSYNSLNKQHQHCIFQLIDRHAPIRPTPANHPNP